MVTSWRMKRWLRTYSPYSARILAFRTIARAAISGVSGKHKVTVNGIKNGSFTLELTVRNAGGSIKFQYPDVNVVNGTGAVCLHSQRSHQDIPTCPVCHIRGYDDDY